MKFQYRIIALLIMLAAVYNLSAEDLYRDYLTGFKDISAYSSKSGFIVVRNKTDKPVFDVCNYDVSDKHFHYTIRLKSVPDGRSSRFLAEERRGVYGIVWNFTDSLNYSSITVNDNIGSGSDILYKESAVVEISDVVNGKKTVLFNKETGSALNTDGGYNSFCLQYNGESLSFLIGEKRLKHVFTIEQPKINECFKVGTITGPKTVTEVRRIQFHSKLAPEKANMTDYTYHQVDSVSLNSRDSKEGYWIYLDRTIEAEKSRLGGRYRLALVKKDGGYDVLYISGATVMPEIWKPLMLKGRLIDTQFIDNYDAVWFDAKKKKINDEGYATFHGNIMTIHLPISGIEVRFQKQRR